MYLRDGKTMGYSEEGAAFFEPIKGPPLGLVPPRTMGINMDLLTRGFVPTKGVGADDAATATALDWKPWAAAAVGAVAGFMLWRRK